MPRKQDLSAERVRKHSEIETDPLAHALGLVNEAALLGAAYDAAQEFREMDWDNPEQRSHAAHYALSLDDLDRPLKKAFESFGLDPRNPFHWRKLLAYLTEAHFGPKRRRGPPKLWADDKLCRLLEDFDQVKCRRTLVPGSKISDVEVCKWLKRHSTLGKTYAAFDAKTILRNLQRARNPRQNGVLGEIVSKVAEPLIAQLRAAAKKRSTSLYQKWEEPIRSMALESAVKALSSQWRIAAERQTDSKETSRKGKLSLISKIDDPDWIAIRRRAGLGY